ncbi:hypothetical protein BUALT_Bualt19G0035100 [Buddleja alternifolia]|uniref:C3H1-type domain-containing protein n=1 Tax=Buddleja alternifolia TaxID=168488 RepID=A0AAV6W724_9LAMI|nr:hypothetical protein BUALT_Bualt19G0035100 [Buddleja alternifolia]
MEFGRKRGRPNAAYSGNGGFKRSKDAFRFLFNPQPMGFNTSGCSFGDTCHFLHYMPGYSAHTQLANSGGNSAVPVGRNTGFTDGPASTMKTKLCNKINTPEGCRFGDKCNFAHSEMELGGKPSYEDPRPMGPMGGFSQRYEPSPQGLPVGNFGASATAKISIDASFAGPIIGKNGVNSKQICRQTGVKFSIRDHETDPNQRNIELEGTFDQIKEASSMVRELMMTISASTGRGEKPMGSFGQSAPSNNYKKKMCENFTKGSCTFGERCRFAHSAGELRA